VQKLGVIDANETGRPELALATSAAGAVSGGAVFSTRVCRPGELNVMICDAGGAAATVMTRETVVAGAKVLLPAWLASMMQVPAATRVNVLPLTVQMLGVVDAKLTVRPELAVATSTGGTVPKV